mmetsp:Transcript_24549/g.53591  ORF Transcript_24549/g.53591 Transcript_24549/m.53591 type:complete len:157 (-) Transcript_24549:325-795(-)
MATVTDAAPPLVRPYLNRAAELREVCPAGSYQLKMLALQTALQQPRSAATNAFLLRLTSELEADAQRVDGPDARATAMRALAIDLFTRANAADQPNTSPHPLQRWSVVDAPKVGSTGKAAAVHPTFHPQLAFYKCRQVLVPRIFSGSFLAHSALPC